MDKRRITFFPFSVSLRCFVLITWTNMKRGRGSSSSRKKTWMKMRPIDGRQAIQQWKIENGKNIYSIPMLKISFVTLPLLSINNLNDFIFILLEAKNTIRSISFEYLFRSALFHWHSKSSPRVHVQFRNMFDIKIIHWPVN